MPIIYSVYTLCKLQSLSKIDRPLIKFEQVVKPGSTCTSLWRKQKPSYSPVRNGSLGTFKIKDIDIAVALPNYMKVMKLSKKQIGVPDEFWTVIIIILVIGQDMY